MSDQGKTTYLSEDEPIKPKSTFSDSSANQPLLSIQMPPPPQHLQYQPQFQQHVAIPQGQHPIDGAMIAPGAVPADYVAPQVQLDQSEVQTGKVSKTKNMLPYNPDEPRPRRQVHAHYNACGNRGMTDVQFTPNCSTCLACTCLLLTTGVCCWIPCVINTCKDARHYCRSCHRQIGISKR